MSAFEIVLIFIGAVIIGGVLMLAIGALLAIISDGWSH